MSTDLRYNFEAGGQYSYHKEEESIAMSFNPFEEKPIKLENSFYDWKSLYPKPYNKKEVSPYTKLRVILMNGTEFEAVWFSHQNMRNCRNNDIRREMALIRRTEQQQQKRISMLKPLDENILEHTIGYEQLAVDLTAVLAMREPDPYVKQALDFALLEDFDHLYRYANLLDMEYGIKAENLVNRYVEITPGRPTISEHRFPIDDVRHYVCFKKAHPLTKLAINIITAAEQQTMNYYMNVGSTYTSDLGRKLYQEICLIEEQHVTHYGSLKDTTCTMLESLLMHEYTECYLYYSCYQDESDPKIKSIWEQHLEQEIAHLHIASELLECYEGTVWQKVIPDGKFPELLKLQPTIEYVKQVLPTVRLTTDFEDYVEVSEKYEASPFFKYQKLVNKNPVNNPSHMVIEKHIQKMDQDYRFETGQHPVSELRDRKADNIDIGRIREA